MESISLILVLALSSVLVNGENTIFGLGKRQSDDQLLEVVTNKSPTFDTPQVIRVDFNIDLGSRYYTYVRFTTPNNNHWNATATDLITRNRVEAKFFARESLSHEVTATVYGYLYSPGPIYP